MTTFRTASTEPSVVVQTADSMRLSRLKALPAAMNDYVKKERTRLTNEASVLTAVLKGRTGGKGIQAINTAVGTAVAYQDLDSYLRNA